MIIVDLYDEKNIYNYIHDRVLNISSLAFDMCRLICTGHDLTILQILEELA
jgi:hypothetical protein